MLLRDHVVVRFARNKRGRDLLEGLVKGLIVDKDPIVVVAAVEAILDLTDGLGNLPDVAVAGKGDKGGVHARALVDGVQIIPSRVRGAHGHGSIVGLFNRGRGLLVDRLFLLGIANGLLGRGLLRGGLDVGIGSCAGGIEGHWVVLCAGDEVDDNETLDGSKAS